MSDTQPVERVRCPRDTGWCDGVICAINGVDCPNADAEPGDNHEAEDFG